MNARKIEITNESGRVIAALVLKVIKMNPVTASRKKDKVITHTNIRAKWDLKREAVSYEYNAEVNLTAQTIRIYGSVKNGKVNQPEGRTSFDRTFKVGDSIKTGSYNLIYTDPIEKLMPNNVCVNHYGGKRMNLYDFISSNWDLDLDYITKHNTNESYYI